MMASRMALRKLSARNDLARLEVKFEQLVDRLAGLLSTLSACPNPQQGWTMSMGATAPGIQ